MAYGGANSVFLDESFQYVCIHRVFLNCAEREKCVSCKCDKKSRLWSEHRMRDVWNKAYSFCPSIFWFSMVTSQIVWLTNLCQVSTIVDIGRVEQEPLINSAWWVIFSNIFFFQKMQKINVTSHFFCWYIIWMSNNLDLRWSPTFCGASSGSKLFAKSSTVFKIPR